ncbi:MAG: hypothetical protein DMF64_21865 [Acidobacteria bacterium]|nr:MAG: hypothetical protein DMF64_21865 [Acidobacteriota bacterium]
MDKEVSQQPQWYAIHTNPKQEERACQNLQAWGVESLSLRLKEHRRNPFTGAAVYVSKPLFPRYIFARFHAGSLLHKISFTRGVHSVVSFNATPIPIDDEIIALFQSRQGSDGFVTIGEKLQRGDKVVIKDGPLKDLVGVFERDVKESDRVMLLLTTVNYQGHLTIARGLVRKACAG